MLFKLLNDFIFQKHRCDRRTSKQAFLKPHFHQKHPETTSKSHMTWIQGRLAWSELGMSPTLQRALNPP